MTHASWQTTWRLLQAGASTHLRMYSEGSRGKSNSTTWLQQEESRPREALSVHTRAMGAWLGGARKAFRLPARVLSSMAAWQGSTVRGWDPAAAALLFRKFSTCLQFALIDDI